MCLVVPGIWGGWGGTRNLGDGGLFVSTIILWHRLRQLEGDTAYWLWAGDLLTPGRGRAGFCLSICIILAIHCDRKESIGLVQLLICALSMLWVIS